MQKTLLGNALIWFGAAVSIAEILTGTLLAPLGFTKAILSILIGHAIGSLFLFFAGLISAESSRSSMDSVKCSFGHRGGMLFSVMNLIQLVGWTAVMIAAGAQAAHGICALPCWLWSVIIGLLIGIWIIVKQGELKVLNSCAVGLLFALTLILSIIVFRKTGSPQYAYGAALSFGEALELSIAMPLSWLPLIGDYTCSSNRPRLVSALSAGVYFLISCWMYLIGLGAALYAGNSDITLILAGAGLGIPALLIVVFSTVTTTYLDVFSAGMTVQSIRRNIPPRATGFAVAVIGVLMAIFCSTSAFENFLYWIGSVFAPMAAIQFTDFFILKKTDPEKKDFAASSLVIWGIGFILYRVLLAQNPDCGSTIPVMILTVFLRLLCHAFSCRRYA